MPNRKSLPQTPAYDAAYFTQVYPVDGPRRFDMHWWSVRWYAAMARRVLRRIGGRRLLEVGCGHGFMLARLEQDFETFGLDISEYAISQAARFAPRSRCILGSLDGELPPELTARPFDLIVAKYVLEHLPDPAAAMRSLAASLRPGGVLFFAVPNTASLGARWKGRDWYALQDPTHCSLLPPEEWLQLTAASGLELWRESADGYWDLPYVRWLPGWLQLPLFIGPTALSCLSGRAVLPARFGENLLVFARKPDGATQA